MEVGADSSVFGVSEDCGGGCGPDAEDVSIRLRSFLSGIFRDANKLPFRQQ